MRIPANGDPHIEVRDFKPARVVRHSALSEDQSLSLVYYYTMEVARQASVPTLDKDTSRRLVSFLRVKEVIQMSQVCKAFWEISCGTSTLYCSLSFSQAPQEADASLMRFIRSRCQQGMEVRNAGYNNVRWLGLCMHACMPVYSRGRRHSEKLFEATHTRPLHPRWQCCTLCGGIASCILHWTDLLWPGATRCSQSWRLASLRSSLGI